MRYKGSGVVLRHQRQSLMVHDNDAKGSTATKDTLFGDEVYVADSMAVRARGFAISAERLKELRDKRLRDILSDGKGREDVAVLFGGLELTAFGTETVTQILQPPVEEEHSHGWREGEALAEAWLIDAEACEFPWPFNRDLRHPRASLPGPELVGFVCDTGGDRFAFAQVKTSKELRFPPSVVHHDKHGLVAQLTALHNDRSLKVCAVMYLGYRATTEQSWCGRYRTAAVRYFNSDAKVVSLFGVLVRDVAPAERDLAAAATNIANACCPDTRVALYGLYLPPDAIPAGPQHAARGKRKGSQS